MKLQRFEVPGLSHYSYILESQDQAVVVDPKRDFDTYIQYADEHDLRITHVLETHIHADFASGANALAEATGAELWLSGHDRGERYQYSFDHRPFLDGQELRVAEIRLLALHTPGHTPEHLSFLIFDERRGTYPVAVLSGDFIFVGSFGRPDLLGEESKLSLARQLFESVHEKISDLPDGIAVYPAHGSGSMCGASISELPQSTLGYERASNGWFRNSNLEAFVQYILQNVPPFPGYYLRMKELNSAGPKSLSLIPGDTALSVEDVRDLVNTETCVVIDLRRPEAFGGAHIPNSLNIGSGPLLSTWASWVVPYEMPILLVGDASTDYEEARRALVRVGLDDIRGYLHHGFAAWLIDGLEQASVPQISVTDMHHELKRGAYVLDVRTDAEWNEGHAPKAHHIFAGELPKRLREIPDDEPVFVTCGSGYRSSLSTSVLRRAGFRNVSNVSGGMNAWKQRGLPTESTTEQSQSRAA